MNKYGYATGNYIFERINEMNKYKPFTYWGGKYKGSYIVFNNKTMIIDYVLSRKTYEIIGDEMLEKAYGLDGNYMKNNHMSHYEGFINEFFSYNDYDVFSLDNFKEEDYYYLSKMDIDTMYNLKKWRKHIKRFKRNINKMINRYVKSPILFNRGYYKKRYGENNA